MEEIDSVYKVCNEYKKTSCIKIEINTFFSTFKRILEDEKITKIFHYARFDVKALNNE